MHVPVASLDDGVQVIQMQPVADDHDNWRLENSPTPGHYYVINENSGMGLQVEDGSLANGAAVVQASLDPVVTHSEWCFQATGDYYNILSLSSGQAIDVSGASQNTGAVLVQWPLKVGGNTANQEWEFLDTTVPTPPPGAPEWEWYQLPIVPSASANLPDGRVVFWSAYSKMNFGGNRGETWISIFDPTTGLSTEALIENTNHDMFCPGTAVLPDGRVMVTGGSSSGKVTFYDQGTDTWSSGQDMNIGRGYHSSKFPSPYVCRATRPHVILTQHVHTSLV
jgi:galactose oxidase